MLRSLAKATQQTGFNFDTIILWMSWQKDRKEAIKTAIDFCNICKQFELSLKIWKFFKGDEL